MSAYMVPNENLSKIAGYLTAVLDGTEHGGLCEGAKALWMTKESIKTFKDIPEAYDSANRLYHVDAIHKALYAMNRDALVARYGKCEDAYEPYDGGKVDASEATREEWQCRLFTIIRNYLYQCAEGNVTETRLYKAVEEFLEVLAETIADETAARDWGCGWGHWAPEKVGKKKSKMGFAYPVAK